MKQQPEDILMQGLKEATTSKPLEGGAPATPAPAVNQTPKIESEADIDARITQMLIDEAKADKEEDEKRLHRQMAARSLSDMGGVFSDMIKASQGAHVSPRDAENHYQRLDDNMRKAYDLYRTRMDLLRRQQADRDRARAAQAGEDARLRMRLDAQKEKDDQADAYKRWKAEKDNKAKIEAAQIKARASVSVKKASGSGKIYTIPFAGSDYEIPAGAYDGRMGQLYAYLDSNNLFPQESEASDELKAVAYLLGSGSGNSNAPESSKQKVATACLVAIHALAGNRNHEDNIIAILKGTYGKGSGSGQGQVVTGTVR